MATLLVLLLMGGTPDWPEFRGPTGQGIATDTGLPLHWGPKENIGWKQAIPGAGWSSPVVVNGRVYLTASVPVGDRSGSDQSLRVLALDAASGKILWQEEVFLQDGRTAPGIHGKNSHASPTPLVHADRLFVHFGHQGTACLDLNGKVLWRKRIAYQPVHGNGGSPVLVDDLLIFSVDGGDQRCVIALDVQTGAERWRTERGGTSERPFSFSTPLVISVAGRQQLISPGSDRVCAYDPRTGEELWHVRYDGYSVVPRPVFGHGLVFVSTGYNSPQLLAIRPDGHGDVTATHIVWSSRRGAPLTPSPVLVGEELYSISDQGQAVCLDARTGKVHWQERLGGNYSASPIAAEGRVYFLSEEGVTTVVRASRKFERLARNSLNERTLASIAVAEGALFLRTEHHLYRIGRPDHSSK